jgi:hypothetical protein
MLRTCAAALSLFLTGCATAPWTQEAIVNAKVFPESRDRVWARVLRTTARGDLSVTGADSANGVVSAELSMAAWDGSGNIHGDWAVCGSSGLLQRPLSQHADLKIVVSPDAAGTSVTINTRFSELRQDRRNRATRRVRCTSTGVLEGQLLESYWAIQQPGRRSPG